VGEGLTRLAPNRLVVADDGLGPAPQRLQEVAAAAVEIGAGRVERDRLIDTGQGLLVRASSRSTTLRSGRGPVSPSDARS
jgi:hypothetical protein